MDINNVMKTIRTLAYSEHRYSLLAQHILENIHDVVKYRVADFAQKTFSSAATISRFAKRLGVNGFGELQHVLKAFIHNISGDSISYSGSVLNVEYLERFHETTIKSINQMYNLVQISQLKETSKLIVKALEIIVISSSEHYWVCFDLVEKFTRIGLNIKFSTSANMQLAYSMLSTKESVVLAVSYSGNDPVVNKYITNTKNNKSTIIAITKLPKSDFALLGDLILCFATNESIQRHVSLTSNVALNHLFNMIFISVLKSDGNKKFQEKLEKTNETIK